MSTPVLVTKLFIPRTRPDVVLRRRLIERLNEGLHRNLTLIAAPAGFGKTTLVSEWVADCGRSTAWLSLDDGDNDPARFLMHLVAAVETVAADVAVARYLPHRQGVQAISYHLRVRPKAPGSILDAA